MEEINKFSNPEYKEQYLKEKRKYDNLLDYLITELQIIYRTNDIVRILDLIVKLENKKG